MGMECILIAAERIAFGRPCKRNLYDPIDDAIWLPPLHDELSGVHSVLRDNVKQTFEVKSRETSA